MDLDEDKLVGPGGLGEGDFELDLGVNIERDGRAPGRTGSG